MANIPTLLLLLLLSLKMNQFGKLSADCLAFFCHFSFSSCKVTEPDFVIPRGGHFQQYMNMVHFNTSIKQMTDSCALETISIRRLKKEKRKDRKKSERRNCCFCSIILFTHLLCIKTCQFYINVKNGIWVQYWWWTQSIIQQNCLPLRLWWKYDLQNEHCKDEMMVSSPVISCSPTTTSVSLHHLQENSTEVSVVH